MDLVGTHTSYSITTPTTIPKRHIRHLPLKRTFDIIFSFMVMLLGLPIYAFVALAVKLTSKGPIFYAQERIGRGGIPFKCYKFRTMHPDADAILESLLNSCPALRAEWDIRRKLEHDPRITPIGRFLRKTSLDELPQFWNVFLGQLSVVGPRPVCEEEITKYYGIKAYKILSLRPGITGVWQTSDRRNMSYDERIQLDEKYVENQHFFYDLFLIVKTIPAMIRPRGAC